MPGVCCANVIITSRVISPLIPIRYILATHAGTNQNIKCAPTNLQASHFPTAISRIGNMTEGVVQPPTKWFDLSNKDAMLLHMPYMYV